MDGKADVKSLMAKFNGGNSPSEDVSGNIRLSKVTGQPTHSGLQTRKAVFEKFASQGNAASPSGPSVSQKPAHPKPPLAVKPSTEDKTEKDPKPPYLKPVGQRFGVQLQATNRESDGKAGYTKTLTKSSDLAKEEPKSLYPKLAGNKLHNSAPQEKEKRPLGTKPNFNSEAQESEEKTSFSKVAGAKEKFMSATQENDPKPSSSKPALAQKPSLNHAAPHNEDTSSKNVFPHKGLAGPRPNMHSFKATKETDENSNCAAETAGSHFSNMALKPTGHWSSASQGTPRNAEEKTEEKGVSATRNIFLNKIIQEESGSSPPKFHKTSTAFAAGRSLGGSEEKDDRDRSSGAPKRKSLPPLFKLGQPPQKPSRPPSVDLERFQKSIPRDSPKNEGFKQMAPSPAAASAPAPPPPPSSHPSLHAPAAPSLPPRNVKPSSETTNPDTEENYDDVEFLLQGRMGPGNKDGDQGSDGEMYEDINDIRTSREKEKKSEKEEKKRMDQEKKEQKEKEKKEQEIRKKFKLTGPIQVLHQARACVDSKGGKNELTVKQGDQIEIIRLTDNPEGKWLGRIKGCYGYIKTTVVEIDYDSLKTKQQAVVKQPEIDQEVYDDVGEQDSISSQSGGRNGAGNMFPPPPSDQEIYDGVDDTDSVPSRSPSTKQFGKDCGDSDVYDDVDSSDFPPPPPEFNLPKSVSLGKGKSDEKYPQKLKMMEREEKEFRKKFKFEGEIKVLYSTTTVQDLSQRKWGSKDLQIKPGETLEVIQSTDDTKVLCRNEEGKYGYVLRSNLVENDGEIYDDIGEDCIYDND
ncbi:FYN-binding protein 1 isoform X4 [Gallus gallus]|uniref:FYN-binding protein 1 isoform X4 n=2 Tax=Gallus gallus TaxID=9031 RepID=UPI000739B0F0|nr:FYN-binding protein 1 isoform X4 [Gallus gallus]XP_046791226.1 FYN-binding protein 1 isoform X4 [Gallus gallus]|eukprot:XP_015132829.1 FYN-binding protein 1 isoform X4 [Gallus gallus]